VRAAELAWGDEGGGGMRGMPPLVAWFFGRAVRCAQACRYGMAAPATYAVHTAAGEFVTGE
jgi:hypothetical protein